MTPPLRYLLKAVWIKKTGWICFVLIFCSTALWMMVSNHGMKQASVHIENQFLQDIRSSKNRLDTDDLSKCPDPVRRYLNYALNGNNQQNVLVRLKHASWIQINLDSNFYEDQNWKYLVAEHLVRLDRPAFFWQALIHLGWEFWLKGWVVFSPHKNELVWTWMGTVPLIQRNESDIKTNGLGQFLLQLPWYPMAMIPSDYLQWEAMDDTSARAILSTDGITVTGIFHFSPEGKVVRLITDSMSRITKSGFIHEPRMVKYVQYDLKSDYWLPERMYFYWKTPKGWISDADFRLIDTVYE